MRRPVCAVATALATVVASAAAALGAGQPDPSFGDEGSVIGLPSPYAASSSSFSAAEPLADGSLVVSGARYLDATRTTVFLGRLNATGAWSSTNAAEPTTATTNDSAADLVVDAAGRYVTVGSAQVDGVRSIVVDRYTSTFARDTGFATDGRLTVSLGDDAVATDVVQGPDGAYLVLARRIDTQRAVVLRVTAAGALDPAFGGGDGVAPVVSSPDGVNVQDLTITPDNRIVLFGGYPNTPDGSGGGAFVARLLPDGSPDPSFSGDGRLPVGGYTFGAGVRLADGSFVAAGRAAYRDGGDTLRLVRISTTGALLAWGGTSSSQRTLLGSYWTPLITSLAAGPDGKLLLGGTDGLLTPGGTISPIVVRTTAAGTYDNTFGRGGIAGLGPEDRPIEHFDGGASVAVDRQGRVVATAELDNRFGDGPAYLGLVARFGGSVSPVVPRLTARQALSTWAPKSCGATDAAACTYAAGATVRFEGRVWPVPTGGAVTLNLVNVNTGEKSAVEVPVSREGNYWVRTNPEGHVRARVVTPASGTTTVARTAWTYLRVPAVAP